MVVVVVVVVVVASVVAAVVMVVTVAVAAAVVVVVVGDSGLHVCCGRRPDGTHGLCWSNARNATPLAASLRLAPRILPLGLPPVHGTSQLSAVDQIAQTGELAAVRWQRWCSAMTPLEPASLAVPLLHECLPQVLGSTIQV